ncbi:hypothetical protein S7711_03243 [Stachybotrys chartarum IBT 7711]|uniref:Uncharacterized protein n=1 Tax=Stachybotrys chartarum (strain CBS 109288 / IBT 7711) TaxID=1280523 RepID=A0A084AZL9_STACB|nr:hypothetical protein S7711_03243 [Stachybotrys chartarum IBT 7711]
MRCSLILLTAASVLASTQPRRPAHAFKGAISFPGAPGFSLATTVECDIGEESCGSGCIPILGSCCDQSLGTWCDITDYCDQGGCCELGSICTGSPSGCDEGYESCGDRCMPEGAVCCNDGEGYCDAGTTCTATGCQTGGSGSGSDDDDDSSSGGSGGDDTGSCLTSEEECAGGCMPLGSVCCGNSGYCPATYTCGSGDDCIPSGGGDDDDDDSSSGGGGGSSGSCLSFQEECGGGCMPLGSVCCGVSGYCPATYTCGSGDDCIASGTSGGGGSGSGDDDDDDDSAPQPTYTLAPVTTSSASSDDDDVLTDLPTLTIPSLTLPSLTLPSASTSSGPVSGDGSEDSGSSEEGGDGASGAGMVLPSLVLGLIALVPMFL